MIQEKIIIANLKCKGCATTIEKELLKIKGVKEVRIDVEGNAVDVNFSKVDRSAIIHKLHSLGYPEATEKNGLLLQLKSYGSCMIGRLG